MSGRICIYVDATMVDPDSRGFIPAVVTENEPGYAPLTGQGDFAQPWVWGPTIEDALRQAAAYNIRLGLKPRDVIDIVMSSMAAREG
jgi:hypothetical protein